MTTHVHDNRGRADDHLPPFAGSIDWDVAMMETQKIGYDGLLMFEVAAHGDAVDTLHAAPTRASGWSGPSSRSSPWFLVLGS